MPADDVGDDPAEQNAEASAPRGDEPEDSHRLRALARLGEEVDHERQRDGGCDRASDPLYSARDHEHFLRGREAAGEGRDREHGDSDQEEAALAVQVAEPAAEQQKASVREQVRVHHPREGRVGETEIVLDRGERDADDRDVEDDHQARQAEDVEGEPAGSGVEFAHRLLVPFVRFRSLRRSNDRDLIGRPIDEFRSRKRSTQHRLCLHSSATSAARSRPPRRSTFSHASRSRSSAAAAGCGCGTPRRSCAS